MADMTTCPHCRGTGVNYIIVPQERKPTIESVDCAVCHGDGQVKAPEPQPEKKPKKRSKSSEFWPILVPLGLFGLFFLFFWY